MCFRFPWSVTGSEWAASVRVPFYYAAVKLNFNILNNGDFNMNITEQH